MDEKEKFLRSKYSDLVTEEVDVLKRFLIPTRSEKFVFAEATLKKINGVEYDIYKLLSSLRLPDDLITIYKNKKRAN